MDLSAVGLFIGEFGRAASISRSERPVKLISAVKRAENGEIGAGILDLRIFAVHYRKHGQRETDR